MTSAKNLPKPFIKWAGGKTKLVPHILDGVPSAQYNYYEPFLGGAALFFALFKKQMIRKAVLNDLNPEISNCYTVIKNSVDALIEELQDPQYQNTAVHYKYIRQKDLEGLDSIKKAARFIYLNRTCFNGLYRVNRKGAFNVPYGKYSNPLILDKANLLEVSKSLENVVISNLHYKDVLKKCKKGDLVYLDPPYAPISKTSNFTEYTSEGFGMKDHEELAEEFKRLKSKGVRCILSNSSSDQIIQLYSTESVEFFSGNRSIGGHPDSRKKIREILVRT
jgi:DNA adenine methylase